MVNIPVSKKQRDLELALIEIWKSLLEKEVERDDDFFILGGDSVSLNVLQRKMTEHLGYEVPTITLSQYSKLDELAYYLTHSTPSHDILQSSKTRASQQKAARDRQKKRERKS